MSLEIIEKYLKKHPECNPEDPNSFVNKPPENCSGEFLQGFGCSYASIVGHDEDGICTDNGTSKHRDKIMDISGCVRGLTSAFNVGALGTLIKGNQILFASLQLQEQVFNQRLDLFEVEVTQKIEVANIISNTNFLIILIIISYLLFSKTFN